jgi:hypothetical protein
MNLVRRDEYMADLTDMKGFSKMLQSYIIAKANSVMDNLALLDLKLKEQDLISKEIENIRKHPSNVNSNLGGNAFW